MGAMASQITGFFIVCSAVCWGADQRKHQSSASGLCEGDQLQRASNAENISFDDVIMYSDSNNALTHWGRVTHICVGKLTIIGSDNGLSPGRRQAIIWTNAGILLIGPLGTNFSEILIEIDIFSFKKMHLKVSFAKLRPFCLGLNELSTVLSVMYYSTLRNTNNSIMHIKFFPIPHLSISWCWHLQTILLKSYPLIKMVVFCLKYRYDALLIIGTGYK